MRLTPWLIVVTSALHSSTVAQSTDHSQKSDTVRFGTTKLNMEAVKTGSSKFAVYSIDSIGNIQSARIWTHTVKLQVDGKRKKIIVDAEHIGDDIGQKRSFRSVNEYGSFQPVSYQSFSSEQGTTAYSFSDQKIIGIDTVTNNAAQGFSMPSSEPTYNWDLDMEIIPTLPLAQGKVFYINWYQPGSRFKPEFYKHTVTGSKELLVEGKLRIDCWVLRLDYSKDSYANFFVTKSSSVLVKVEQYSHNKLTRVKTKLLF